MVGTLHLWYLTCASYSHPVFSYLNGKDSCFIAWVIPPFTFSAVLTVCCSRLGPTNSVAPCGDERPQGCYGAAPPLWLELFESRRSGGWTGNRRDTCVENKRRKWSVIYLISVLSCAVGWQYERSALMETCRFNHPAACQLLLKYSKVDVLMCDQVRFHFENIWVWGGCCSASFPAYGLTIIYVSPPNRGIT